MTNFCWNYNLPCVAYSYVCFPCNEKCQWKTVETTITKLMQNSHLEAGSSTFLESVQELRKPISNTVGNAAYILEEENR